MGIGIPEEDHKHLFERFFRGSNAGNIQGTGLGLHIVAKFAELMNGTISSKKKETGTAMSLVFNLNKHLENNAEIDRHPLYKIKILLQEAIFMKKILLIEDNQNIRENTAEILELANYKVCTAENGRIGVEIAIQENPDLIICDIMMPVLDGYGVLHLLHKNLALQNTPFIFLTAKAEKDDIRKGMVLGADDYLIKPFDGTELLNAVASRLKKRELIKKEFSPDLNGLSDLMMVNGRDNIEFLTSDRNINKYKKKQVIYSEGNRPSRLYYITKGKVKTYKTNPDGKELIIGMYNEGDFLGYVALLEESAYKEIAEALEDCELALIPKEDFKELMNVNRDVAKKFIGMLAKNITSMEEQLLKMAYDSLRKKVADTLLTLHNKYNAAIDISRDNLATLAGTATESMIRTLGDFKSEKLIEIKDGSIFILNLGKLGAMAN